MQRFASNAGEGRSGGGGHGLSRKFLLVKEVQDSVPEFRFVHTKFTCRTVGEESLGRRKQSLGHQICLASTCVGQLVNCEKCGPLGCSGFIFP